jgi:hypothetical protein
MNSLALYKNFKLENNKNMTASNFSTTFFVNQSPEEIFNAINNVSNWWQGNVNGNSTKLNDEFDYRMKEHHYSKQRLVELIPNEKVVWLVIDSNLNSFTDKNEWTGTKIVFEIKILEGKTQVCFTHFGLTPSFMCYNDCSWAWEKLVQQSLYSLITTGKGIDVFG